jgi:hypothetical protein
VGKSEGLIAGGRNLSTSTGVIFPVGPTLRRAAIYTMYIMAEN